MNHHNSEKSRQSLDNAFRGPRRRGAFDPESEDWTGVKLVDADTVGDPPYAMLHDDFYDKYWDWRKTRGDKGWRLDM